MLTAFPLQQWVCEGALVLRDTCIVCLVFPVTREAIYELRLLYKSPGKHQKCVDN